ncbi:MAG: hypothetical protein IPG98_13460 [Burkholderiales bacterium]|nr:hypothetical protein [Burkholderiales bacterium]
MNRGVALQLQGKHAEALAALEAAENVGFKEQALYYRAVSQAALRQFHAAYDNYTTALELPQDEQARRRTVLERAQVALPAKQYASAITDLKSLLAYQPGNDRLKFGLGMAYRATTSWARPLPPSTTS